MCALVASIVALVGALPTFAVDNNSQQEPSVVSEHTYNLPSESPDMTITVTETTYSDGTSIRDTLTAERVLDPVAYNTVQPRVTGKVYPSVQREMKDKGGSWVATMKVDVDFQFDDSAKTVKVLNTELKNNIKSGVKETTGNSPVSSTGSGWAKVSYSYRLYDAPFYDQSGTIWVKSDYNGYTTKSN